MLSATCHCGRVRIEVPQRPRTLTSCNCSICRRYGTLWAYYPAPRVRIVAPPRGLDGYVWGDRQLEFVRCARCGCVVCWRPVVPTAASRMGVNARNFDPRQLGDVRIRRLDGASSWKFLPDALSA
jgi:hypothetical protein